MSVITAAHQRMVLDALGQADEAELGKMWQEMGEPKLIEKISGRWFVMIPCQCDTPQAHGPHWVSLFRIRKGGDLYGKLRLEDINVPGV